MRWTFIGSTETRSGRKVGGNKDVAKELILKILPIDKVGLDYRFKVKSGLLK